MSETRVFLGYQAFLLPVWGAEIVAGAGGRRSDPRRGWGAEGALERPLPSGRRAPGKVRGQLFPPLSVGLGVANARATAASERGQQASTGGGRGNGNPL